MASGAIDGTLITFVAPDIENKLTTSTENSNIV